MPYVDLDIDNFKFGDMRLSSTAPIQSHTSLAQKNALYTNGALQHILRAEIIGVGDEERDYIHSIIESNLLQANALRFKMPQNIYNYRGSSSSLRFFVHINASSGSNVVAISMNDGSFPTASELYSGQFVQFGEYTGLYRISSYDQATGQATIFPFLERDVAGHEDHDYTNATEVFYLNSDIKFVGRQVLNAGRIKFRTIHSKHGFVRINLTLNEVREILSEI